jgi:MFS transporter, YNFM family, putative membrane transport protein
MEEQRDRPGFIRTGTPAFWRMNLAMIAAAFCTFALIYCVQPLMPVLAADFRISPAVSSLALSVTTLVLAVALLPAGGLAEAFDRKSFMGLALVCAATVSIGTAVAPTFHWLLFTRALAGVALSGLPAVAMAYIGEEVEPQSVGPAMGLYVGGTALGGMSGRLWAGVLCDLLSWRWAIGIIGVFGLIAVGLFWLFLPRSRQFIPHRPRMREQLAALLALMADSGLRSLFAMGFLLLGAFVSVYNYIGFRLVAPPYHLSQSVIGLLFTLYVVGMFSSTWAGRLAGVRGPATVIGMMVAVMGVGVLVTLCAPLWLVLVGVSGVTFGFFGGHAVASGWVARRAGASKALGSSAYLFAYYIGSSAAGSVVGKFWSSHGWPGVAGAVGVLLVIALVVSLKLTRVTLAPVVAQGATTSAGFDVPSSQVD